MKPAEQSWLMVSEGPVSLEIRELLARIDRCCEARNWTHGYFGKHVAGDDTIIPRLRNTGRVQVRLVLVIEKFLEDVDRGEEEGEGAP